jgi:hypothetical protein
VRKDPTNLFQALAERRPTISARIQSTTFAIGHHRPSRDSGLVLEQSLDLLTGQSEIAGQTIDGPEPPTTVAERLSEAL